MNEKKFNTNGIKEHAKKKSEEARKKVDEAIKSLVKEKGKINFNSVAEKAGVTKPFLYKQEDLRERIEKLREQQSKVTTPKAVKQNMSDKSKDSMIELLRNKISVLERENAKLKKENAEYKGQIYDQI